MNTDELLININYIWYLSPGVLSLPTFVVQIILEAAPSSLPSPTTPHQQRGEREGGREGGDKEVLSFQHLSATATDVHSSGLAGLQGHHQTSKYRTSEPPCFCRIT